MIKIILLQKAQQYSCNLTMISLTHLEFVAGKSSFTGSILTVETCVVTTASYPQWRTMNA